MPVGEDEFVELDEEGNPKRRSAPARRQPAPAGRGRKPAPRRKVPVTVIPGAGPAAAAPLEDAEVEGEVDEADPVADAAPAESRPASAPRRRTTQRRTPARGA
jgi:hypothetical protein